MRIALFSDNFYPEIGGIQDSVLTLGRALAARGHSIAFCVPSFSERDCRLAGVPFRELDLPGNISVLRFASIHVPSSTQQSRLVIPTWRRWKALKDFRPEIIHAHTFLGLGLEAITASRRFSAPLIGTNHTTEILFSRFSSVPSGFLARVAGRLMVWYYNRCLRVTAPSQSLIDEMRKNGLRVAAVSISNPIDTDAFSPVPDERRRELRKTFGFTAPVVMYAGRLALEKSIDVVMRAVASVPDVTLALAGHGNFRPELERLSRDLGIADRVRFLGTLDKPALADLFRASDVFAMASTTETQSMVTLQAMACGVPAVGVHAEALPEYIENGVTGQIVPRGDHAAMGEAIRRLLSSPELRHRQGQEAARQVREHYGIEAIVKKFEEVYECHGEV